MGGLKSVACQHPDVCRPHARSLVPTASYPTRMLLVLSLGWAVLQCGRFLLPPLLPRITDALGFSPGGIGTALTAFGLAYAVVQYPSGTYSDALSRATLILPGFVVLLASFLVVGAAVTPWLFVLGIILLGVGKGLYASPTRALIGEMYDGPHRGRALGVYTAGTDVGGLLAAGLAVAVLAMAGWRVAFVPVVAVLAAVTLLYVVWNREQYELRRVRLDLTDTAGRIVATRDQREMVVAFSIFYFFVGGLANFFPTLPVVAVGTVLAALGYKTQFPIADAIVMDAAPAANVGGDLGAARGVFLAANAIGPGFVGLVAEFASYRTAFLLLTGTLLISIVLLGRQHWRR